MTPLSEISTLIIVTWSRFLKMQSWSLRKGKTPKNVCYQLLKLYGKYCTNGNWHSAKRMHLQSSHLSKMSHHDSFKCDTLVSIWCLANEVQTNSLNKRCRHCFSFTLELLMQIYQCSWSNWSSRSNVPNEQRPKSYLKLLYLEGCQRHLLSNGILCGSVCEGSLAYHTIAVLLLHYYSSILPKLEDDNFHKTRRCFLRRIEWDQTLNCLDPAMLPVPCRCELLQFKSTRDWWSRRGRWR